jgi:hypothetical protein
VAWECDFECRGDTGGAGRIGAQDQHPVGENNRLFDIVRHQDRGGPGLVLHRVEQVLHP